MVKLPLLVLDRWARLSSYPLGSFRNSTFQTKLVTKRVAVYYSIICNIVSYVSIHGQLVGQDRIATVRLSAGCRQETSPTSWTGDKGAMVCVCV